LEAEFPSLDQSCNVFPDGKRIVNSRHIENDKEAFFEGRPHWRRVIDILESQDFISDVERLLRPYLLRHRYCGTLRKWVSYPKKHMPVLERGTQVAYEWSAMPNGSLIKPHTDKCAKLVTFVWHFPEKNWKLNYQGNTVFYKAKNPRHDVNWSNFKVPFDDVVVLESANAKANRLIMFAKTGNSWHGVPPIECPEGVMRRVFVFNIGMPFDQRTSFSMRAFESFHRRNESWRFKDFPDINAKRGM